MTTKIAVREITEEDIILISEYWQRASPEYLNGMGADINLLPDAAYFQDALQTQIQSDYPDKQSYCIIWLVDDKPVGHCNVNKIVFGQEAYMHLHLWHPEKRQQGLGVELVKMSLPFFFKNLQLKTLYCEPYALNPAPNNVLQKVGFEFLKEYITIPGALNFEQPVKRWALDIHRYQTLL